MSKKEVVDYIRTQLKNGQHIDRIKDKLISAGHPARDIEEAASRVNSNISYKKSAILESKL